MSSWKKKKRQFKESKRKMNEENVEEAIKIRNWKQNKIRNRKPEFWKAKKFVFVCSRGFFNEVDSKVFVLDAACSHVL